MNVAVLIGRLTKDPEMRYAGDKAVVSFTLAVDNPHKKDDTSFIPIVAWGKTAENVGNYLTKGSQCAVQGRIQVRNYDDKEGNKRWVTEVVADRVQFLGKKGAE